MGLVYIACSYNGNVKVQEFHLKGERAKIRESAVVKALTMLREYILEEVR